MIKPLPPPRRPRPLVSSSPQPAPLLAHPPVSEGIDAVTAWVNQVNLAQMSAQDKSKKAVALQALISAFGRVRNVAKDIELLLRAREQRDAVPANVAAAPSPPSDTLALPLWHAFELARLIKLVADTAELAADDVKALQKRIKHHVAGVTVRDTGAVDEFKRRHRISNVADAVASYEQVQAQLAEEALTERDAIEARDDLIAFGKFMSSEFTDPWHIQVIADALMRVERGEVSGLVLNVPPRHGKTQLASILFAAWYCGRHPDRDVIVGCMSAEFAENNIGGPVRNLIASPEFRRVFPGVNVSPDTAAKGAFRVYREDGSVRQRKGLFAAMGRGGAPTGKGASLLLLDDFLSEADAYSHTERAKLFDEIFRFRSRLAPDASWIVINTRYHEDDVVGIIQRRYVGDRKWETISLPVYAEQDEVWRITRPATAYRAAETVTHTRKAGDILWPYRRKDIEAIRSVLEKESPQMWSGQFMCRPVPASGAMVDIAWFRRYDYAEVAAIRKRAARVVVSVDTGGTRLRQLSGSAARTAASVWAEMEDGKVYLLDVRAEAWAYFDMVQAVKDICADWKPTELLIENKAAGLELIADLREDARWVRTPITSIDPIGSKETRMSVASPPIRAGHVYVPATGTCADVRDPSRPPLWVVDYLNEMQHFPMSSRRDQVDTTSQFLNWRREHPMYLVGVSITPNSDAKKAFLGQLGGPWGRGGGGMARGR